ncbi:MAG: hypothetical protein M3Q10_11500 [Chloroflexota bacterium]|nr:hypothetical protein [Chloroflexota bacterium]
MTRSLRFGGLLGLVQDAIPVGTDRIDAEFGDREAQDGRERDAVGREMRPNQGGGVDARVFGETGVGELASDVEVREDRRRVGMPVVDNDPLLGHVEQFVAVRDAGDRP